MSVILYLLLLLTFSVASAIIIARINTNTRDAIQHIKQKKKEIVKQYNKHLEEIEELKKEIQTITNQIQEEKKKAQLKKIIATKPEKEEKKPLTPVEVLLEKGIITEEHIKKAEDFIKKSNSNSEILGVLLLLGYIDHNQYQLAKEEAS